MTSEIISVSLPARFLSMGQDPASVLQASSASFPDSFLLIVRYAVHASGVGKDSSPGRQALLLSPGASLPDGFMSVLSPCWYWIRFRCAADPDAVQVHFGSQSTPLSETAFNRFSYGFHQLLWENDGSSRSSDLCDYLLSVLLLSLQDDNRQVPRSAVAARLLEYIHLHCCEQLTLPDVARDLGYNEDYLSRLLHEQVSCSFRQYIHRLRMQRAKKELLSGFRSVQDIAEDCGYTNAKFFSTSFLKYEGLTPSAFRNLYASRSGREDLSDDYLNHINRTISRK